jgi:hypothetical protein
LRLAFGAHDGVPGFAFQPVGFSRQVSPVKTYDETASVIGAGVRANLTIIIIVYNFQWLDRFTGGRGGIRTHGTLAGTPVFKTGALNHSATLPNQ